MKMKPLAMKIYFNSDTCDIKHEEPETEQIT